MAYALKLRRDGKFDERGRACIFIGYPLGQKGYKVYDAKNNEIYVSRDVVFFENDSLSGKMHKFKNLNSLSTHAGKMIQKSHNKQHLLKMKTWLLHREHNAWILNRSIVHKD